MPSVARRGQVWNLKRLLNKEDLRVGRLGIRSMQDLLEEANLGNTNTRYRSDRGQFFHLSISTLRF
jgi:hypothetical protein